jgi:UDPglucose 6-dehydrogenase
MIRNTISLIGVGKLGAPIAGCLAAAGHKVIAVDVNPEVVACINHGIPPVYEPGLKELLEQNRENLAGTSDLEHAVHNSNITFILVPTPTDTNGRFSLRFVLEACEKIGKALQTKREFHLVVLTSTVMPGSTGSSVREALEKASAKKCGDSFGLCYSPEFVALGSVIRDFLEPDFLLIGESDARSGDLLEQLYRTVCKKNPPVARMNFVNAELTKLSVNTFVTTKITFANMLARICERMPEANVDEVTRALGLDSRIGSKYLKGAVGYGGPCFPRDNLALGSLARELGIAANLAEATDRSNRAEAQQLAWLVKKKNAPNGAVAILGLSYKPNTNIVEESAGIYLAQSLAHENVSVSVYDPAGIAAAKKVLPSTVRFCESMKECVPEADTIVITTPWKEFSELPALLSTKRKPVVIDCWRMLKQPEVVALADYIQLGIGRDDYKLD